MLLTHVIINLRLAQVTEMDVKRLHFCLQMPIRRIKQRQSSIEGDDIAAGFA